MSPKFVVVWQVLETFTDYMEREEGRSYVVEGGWVGRILVLEEETLYG